MSLALEIADPIDIAPVRDVSDTPPVPDVVMVAEVVTVAQLTLRSEAMLIAPPTFAKAPAPAQVKERLFVEVMVSPVETEMLPALSTRTFELASAVTKSEARMLVADAAVAWKTPFTNSPAVVPELVTVIDEATKVGATERVVPTNASEVTVKVCAGVPTPLWKPSPEKVTRPFVSDVAITEVTFEVVPLTVC